MSGPGAAPTARGRGRTQQRCSTWLKLPARSTDAKGRRRPEGGVRFTGLGGVRRATPVLLAHFVSPTIGARSKGARFHHEAGLRIGARSTTCVRIDTEIQRSPTSRPSTFRLPRSASGATSRSSASHGHVNGVVNAATSGIDAVSPPSTLHALRVVGRSPRWLGVIGCSAPPAAHTAVVALGYEQTKLLQSLAGCVASAVLRLIHRFDGRTNSAQPLTTSFRLQWAAVVRLTTCN